MRPNRQNCNDAWHIWHMSTVNHRAIITIGCATWYDRDTVELGSILLGSIS